MLLLFGLANQLQSLTHILNATWMIWLWAPKFGDFFLYYDHIELKFRIYVGVFPEDLNVLGWEKSMLIFHPDGGKGPL